MLMDYEITELHRRLANLIRIGRVAAIEVNEMGAKAQVSIGELNSTWLPILSLRAGRDHHLWLPDVDEQVLILSPSGDLAQGVIVGALPQARFPIAQASQDVHHCCYADGAVIAYNKTTHSLTVDLPPGGTVQFTGDVQVTGNITATEHISDGTRTMDADRAIYNSHRHSGVRSGGSSTATPSASQ